MKITTKQVTQTALLLALCIISQLLKNTSVYITGPIINAILVVTLLTVNLPASFILCIIVPLTSFLITGSPIMAAIPLMFPVIMIGNMLLVLAIWTFYKKKRQIKNLYFGMFLGCTVKTLFMWIMTSFVLFPLMGSQLKSFIPKPEIYKTLLASAKVTFSITQFITAVAGCVLAVIIMVPLRKYLKNQE